MSKIKTVRTGLLGSAAVFALLTIAPAQAVEAQFGDVSISFDTTVSMGASMLTQGRETKFLPEANGGPVDPRADLALGATITGTVNTPSIASFGALFGNVAPGCIPGCLAPVGQNVYTANGNNFDGSLNTDDGRLNFDKGDLIGANVKASHDLLIKWQNYSIFARGVGFYDVIMNDKNVGDHSQLTDQALGDVGRNYDLLDLFVSADYTLGDLPVNLRVGKQVINWGESTFIQNGLNVFNPIDVAAIRKPGSEIKEALVPVNAVFASVSFPFQVSMSGWYALDWEPFEIDPSGTPFSTADSVAMGSGFGGNEGLSFVTGSPFGGNRRNCAPGAGTAFAQTSGLLNNPLVGAVGNNLLECGDSPFVPNTVRIPNGQHELIRIGQATGAGPYDLTGDGATISGTGLLYRGEDYHARDGGQYGLKMTWFSDDLNGTEFGFYYQNYHSRLPFALVESTGNPVGNLSFFLNSGNTELATGITSRALPNLGCGLTSPTKAGSIAVFDVDPGPGFNPGAGLTMNGAIGSLSAPAKAQLQATLVNDPGGVMTTAAAAVAALSGGLMTLYDADPGVGTAYNNQYAIAQLNCVLAYYQSGFVNPGTGTTVQTFDNAEFVLGNGDGQLSITYPEDIEIFGFSLNTTLGGIGVQAEATYRPSAPFQVDTDSLTIASLVNGCTFEMLYGAAGPIVDGLATPDGSGIKPSCGSGTASTNPVIRGEMFTAQIGTTSQMTGSDWFIDMIGADIGTVVTEIGMVFTPSVEDSWADTHPATAASLTQYANTGCQGTDLPGGGILGLDKKASAQCRPTDLSAGMVFLFTVQYNNFLDTGFAVSPRIVYSYDFEGTTAAPYGNYMEDRQAINLGLDGTLNNNLRLGLSYSNFFGGHVNNKSRDRDFASVSASYSF